MIRSAAVFKSLFTCNTQSTVLPRGEVVGAFAYKQYPACGVVTAYADGKGGVTMRGPFFWPVSLTHEQFDASLALGLLTRDVPKVDTALSDKWEAKRMAHATGEKL
jgi:hypothetical protein